MPFLLLLAGLWGALLGGASLVLAQATPAGGELAVNQFTTGAQAAPQVVGLADGGFVVVWQSTGQDGDQDGVFARLYTAVGAPVGGEFQVNEWTTGSQEQPVVAADASGGFVVVWQSQGQDGSANGIVARRFGGTGVPDGAEFAVNEFTTGNQMGPAVAGAPDGTFVVAWSSYEQDGDFFGVFARRFPGAAPAGAEFQVNTWTTGAQYDPAVAMDPDGDFVVVWDGPSQFGDDVAVLGRPYSSDGDPLGEFQANGYTPGLQYRAEVAVRPAGDLVVVWNGEGFGDSMGIFARRFDAAGAPAGGEFIVNMDTDGLQYHSAIAADADGSFAIVWQGRDESSYGILAAQFGPDGARVGGDTPVNTYTTSEQGRPGVAMLANGDFVVVWRSNGQDGSGLGARGRRFAGPIASTTTTTTTVPGGGGSTTSTTLPAGNGTPIAVRALLVRPANKLKIVAPGPLAHADPTVAGASLQLTGTTGTATYDLPAACWKPKRTRGGTTKGYRCRQGACTVSLAAKKGLRARCRGTVGDLGPLPEPGPVDVVLSVGVDAWYCGRCGGTPKGRETKAFKRRACAAPAACP